MLSVVVPAYNEGDGLRLLYERLTAAAAGWGEAYEVILVDDGSQDHTPAVATELAARDARWKVLVFSRNFGHQPAISAGLRFAQGDLVAVIDADLQDPPEELARFFNKAREGYDVVFAVRTRRKEGVVKRFLYFWYYRLLDALASITIPLDAGDFCVVSRRAVDALNALPERNRFIRGMRSWIGYRQVGLTYERHGRHAGRPKYTLGKLINLAMDGIVNFSRKPLRWISVLGLAVGFLATVTATLVLLQYVFDWTLLGYNPHQAQGWTSTILVILFLASAQFFCLGIMAEYLGRLFEEVKQRPVYLIERRINFEPTVSRDGQPPAPQRFEAQGPEKSAE